MQPRRVFDPLRPTVFHVTNNGYSSFSFASCCRRREREKRDPSELVELAGVSAPEGVVLGLLTDDAVDLVDWRLLDELPALVSRFSRRDIAAGLAEVVGA